MFEPSPETYFFLRCNLYLNRVHVLTSEELQWRPAVPGVYPVFGGLGGAAPFEMAIIPKESQSQNRGTSFSATGDVPVYNLRSFLSTHGLDARRFDLLKLDCECCEYRVVPDSRDWITNRSLVGRLAGEIHPCFAGSKKQQRTLDILRGMGCRFPERNFKENGDLERAANLLTQLVRTHLNSSHVSSRSKISCDDSPPLQAPPGEDP